eukprot:jgi/Ulvmu1/9509/UM052_0082.1
MTEAGPSEFRSSCVWGPETDAGALLFETLQKEQAQAADAGSAQPAKRRRTKWGPQATDNPVVVPKISGIELPRNLAILATALDTGCLELQYDLLQTNNRINLMDQGLWTWEGFEGEPRPAADPAEQPQAQDSKQRTAQYREKLVAQKNEIIRDLIRANPAYQPPAGWRPPVHTRKVDLEPHKHRNCVALIIGSGGSTKRDLEARTGAKIFIRGDVGPQAARGARHAHARPAAQDEPLHVFISADNQPAVEQAAEFIEQILKQPARPAAVTAGTNGGTGVAVATRATDAAEAADGGQGSVGDGAAGDPASAAAAAAAAIVRAKLAAAGGEATAGGTGAAAQGGEGGGEWQWGKGNTAAGGTETGAAGAATAADGAAAQHSVQQFFSDLNGGAPGSGGAAAAAGGSGDGMPAVGHRGGVDPNCKLFVGQLPPSMNDAALRALFSHYGLVTEAEVMRNRETGASRMFAFVHMSTPEQAAVAISALNGFMMEGRQLLVSIKGQRRTQPPMPGAWPPGAYGAQQPLMPLMVPEDAPPGVDPEDMPLLPPPPIQPVPVHAPMRAAPRLAAAPPPRPKLLPEAIGIGPAATDDTDLPPPGLELEVAAAEKGKGEMQEKPMHAIPVALSAEEKRRVERREATQEQRADAEAERRQRLLAAAAAAVKKSAPAGPPKAAGGAAATAPRKALPAPKRDALLKAEAEKKRAREEAAAAEAHARRGAFMELRESRGAPPPPRHPPPGGSGGGGEGGDLREALASSRERAPPTRGYSRDREQRPPPRDAYHSMSPGPPPQRTYERRPPPPPPMRPDRVYSESPPLPRAPLPPQRRPVSRERLRPRSSELLASPSPSPRAPPLRRPPGAEFAHQRAPRPPRRPPPPADFRGADENHRYGRYDSARAVDTDRWDGGSDAVPEKPARGRNAHPQRGDKRDRSTGNSPVARERQPVQEPEPQIVPEPSESGEIVTSDEEGRGGKEVGSGKRGPDRAAAAAAAERLLRRSPSVSEGDLRSMRKAPTGPRRGPGPHRDADSGRNGVRW